MQEAITVLAIGMENGTLRALAAAKLPATLVEMTFEMEKLIEAFVPAPGIILAGLPPAEISVAEVAQLLRGVYPDTPIHFIADIKHASDRKDLIKNGFTEVFFLPIDLPPLFQSLREGLALQGSQERVYRNVKVLDVAPDTVLDFNTYLYLPANKKHVKFSTAGDSLDEDRVKKLKSHSVASLCVPIEEMKKFYSYTASRLKDLNGNTKISETERSERLESSVREVVTGLFSDTATSTEQGKAAVSTLQSIVRSYVVQSSPKGSELYNRFLAIAAQSGSAYARASATSTYAALFAIGLGLKDVDDIALAGILHDLGMAKVPAEVLALPSEHWLPADREVYESHPDATVQIIRDRKLVVSENVYKIIQQHHETYSGTGFPRKLEGDRICMGAQLLAIADALFDATQTAPGKPLVTPKAALEQLLADTWSKPGQAKHNSFLLRKLLTLFEAEAAPGATLPPGSTKKAV
jgi:HD-GYP domain-containing protein (c-di-GMP phosphodiesterase class II)